MYKRDAINFRLKADNASDSARIFRVTDPSLTPSHMQNSA